MTAPLLEIDVASPTPAYRQIANGLRRHLVEGRLQAGYILPPVRQVALDLGVHFNTVAQAYRALADEGWLDLKRRRGAMVVDRQAPRRPDAGHVTSLLRRVRDLTAELRSAGLTQAEIARALRQMTKRA